MLFSVDDLFQSDLQKLYSVEMQLMAVLPELAEFAQSEELKRMLLHHLEESKNQVKRLEDIGAEIDIDFNVKQDVGIKGIVDESKAIVEEIDNPLLVDPVIIEGSEKAEYYEMASYKSAIELAKRMGMDEVAGILEKTYDEERNSAKMLKEMEEDGTSSPARQKTKIAL